jgi:hypothetical protein
LIFTAENEEIAEDCMAGLVFLEYGKITCIRVSLMPLNSSDRPQTIFPEDSVFLTVYIPMYLSKYQLLLRISRVAVGTR